MHFGALYSSLFSVVDVLQRLGALKFLLPPACWRTSSSARVVPVLLSLLTLRPGGEPSAGFVLQTL